MRFEDLEQSRVGIAYQSFGFACVNCSDELRRSGKLQLSIIVSKMYKWKAEVVPKADLPLA